ncbi:MAG: nucleotidyl transferase AbiEii/AbiGii toxin family protein [Chitinophagaceae bacterium]
MDNNLLWIRKFITTNDNFSEDIDIHIRTDFGLPIEGKEDKPQVKEARKKFYDTLAENLSINGIIHIERDHEFDDTEKYRSGGIRLYYQSYTPVLEGLKDGILLEAGFDKVTPNTPINISSWVWEHLKSINANSAYIDNTAKGVHCYHPGYTLVEKLQTIISKYRKRNYLGAENDKNFMRQYYDVYCLLGNQDIIDFIGSPEYIAHKAARIKGADKSTALAKHPALRLEDSAIRESFKTRYLSTSKLYYKEQPKFEQILERINRHLHKL